MPASSVAELQRLDIGLTGPLAGRRLSFPMDSSNCQWSYASRERAGPGWLAVSLCQMAAVSEESLEDSGSDAPTGLRSPARRPALLVEVGRRP